MSSLTQAQYAALTTEQLFEEYRRAPDDALKWEIVLRYTGVIKNIALQIQGVYASFAQLDDIVNEGLIVLSKAVDKYDPSIGKFETYVAKRIRGMIIDLARRQDWVPRPVRKRAKEMDAAVSALYHRLGRFPSDSETAAYMGISEAEYQSMLSASAVYSVVSLEETLEGGDQLALNDQNLADLRPELSMERTELLESLTSAISTLRENEQIVLSLYYQKDMKMKDIAEVLGVSHARASQIHTRAIQKLKVLLTED